MDPHGVDIPASIEKHYHQGALLGAIKEALARQGKDDRVITSADLAGLDAFHLGGHPATIQLARRVSLRSGLAVLDVGCGLGGGSRYLAETYGCSVLGIDLTEEYVSVASELAAWVGCADRVRFLRASALEIPTGDGQFDVVWTQHVQMNVLEKFELYSEFARVLKPGGLLVFHEVFLGSGGPVLYPVPWANEESISFLSTQREARCQIEAAGFCIETWEDVSEPAAESLRKARGPAQSGTERRPSVSMLLGEDADLKLNNAMDNLAERRITVVQAVANRVDSGRAGAGSSDWKPGEI